MNASVRSIHKLVFHALISVMSISLTTSCVSSGKEDEMAEFFRKESLELTGFRAERTSTGHHLSLRYTDPNDPNRNVEGALFLVDVEMKKAEAEEADQKRRKRLEMEREDGLNNPNLTQIAGGLGVKEIGMRPGEWGMFHSPHPLDSDRIRKRFPDHRIFSVTCSDPIMHPFYISQPLVIPARHNNDSGSVLRVLLNAPTVATFISDHKQPVRDVTEARETLDLFCELQSWTVQKEIPEHVRNWEVAQDADWLSRWTYRQIKIPEGWRFHAVFLTDPVIWSYTYAEVDVRRDGTLKIQNQELMGASSAYR